MALGKLTKKEQKEFDEMRDALREKVTKLRDTVDRDYGVDPDTKPIEDEGAWKELRTKFHESFTDAAEQAETLRDWAETFQSTQQDQWDEKSERWQESDRGSEVSDFISEWERIATADIPEVGDEQEPHDEDQKDEDAPGGRWPLGGQVFMEYDSVVSDMQEFMETLDNVPLEVG